MGDGAASKAEAAAAAQCRVGNEFLLVSYTKENVADSGRDDHDDDLAHSRVQTRNNVSCTVDIQHNWVKPSL